MPECIVLSGLLAGFSSAAFSEPTELIGFGLTARPCTGISDPLNVQSLVLEDGVNRLAIVTLDLLAIDFEEVSEIRRRVARLGFPPENVMIAASHTHSGPPAIDFGFVRKSESLGDEIVDKVERNVIESVRSLSRASVRTGFAEFPHNANRRQRTWLVRTKLGVNLSGPVDHQLSSALVENAHGRVLVLCYGCHPVINKEIPLASADYVGGIRQFALSAGITSVLFLNGALGDVNPYDREKRLPLGGCGAKVAADFGSRMASCALNSLEHQGGNRSHVSTASASLELSLPKSKDGELSLRPLLQAFKLEDLVLAAFPGEIFAETALATRNRMGLPHLAIVSCANGYMGYLPPRKEYWKAGYEVLIAPKVFGYSVPAGVGERLQKVAEGLIAKVTY